MKGVIFNIDAAAKRILRNNGHNLDYKSGALTRGRFEINEPLTIIVLKNSLAQVKIFVLILSTISLKDMMLFYLRKPYLM